MSEATTLITTRMSRLPSTSGDVGHPPEGIISVDIVTTTTGWLKTEQ